MVLIVDGTNLLHALGWAGDGPDGARRLADRLQTLTALDGDSCVVCFDGVEPLGTPHATGPVRTSGGRPADEVVLAAVREVIRQGGDAVVLSGDRALGDRAIQLGGRVVAPEAWLQRLVDSRSTDLHGADPVVPDQPPGSLRDRLDPGIAARLEQLRRGR